MVAFPISCRSQGTGVLREWQVSSVTVALCLSRQRNETSRHVVWECVCVTSTVLSRQLVEQAGESSPWVKWKF